MLSCNCLNVIIESETNDFQQVTADLFNLTPEEKQDIFFQQEIKQVNKLGRISKEHSGLVVSRNVGNWIVHQCLNCDVHTHAIHRDRGAACVLVASKLLPTDRISTLRASNQFSNTFNILVPTEKDKTDKKQPEGALPPDVQLALGGLKNRVTEVVNREVAATEERVRHFTEMQYEALEKFREKANNDHKVLARVILEKRYQPSNLSNIYSMASPPNTRLSNDNVPDLTANTKPPTVKTKKSLQRKAKRDRLLKIAIQMGHIPADTVGLFELEEVEGDVFTSSSSEDDDEFNEDLAAMDAMIEPEKEEASHVSRYNKLAQLSIARSLPVNIPIFMSENRNRDSEDEHDDILNQTDEHPSDIAASIKALAKSVHGDTVFGDLPRPRFSTQI